jgi:hypothetical protein
MRQQLLRIESMTQEMILAFARHMVKRIRKGKRVTIKMPRMSGAELDMLLRTLERVHGYAQ